MPQGEFPLEFRAVTKPIDDLIAVLASRSDVPDELAKDIDAKVLPQVRDWNLGNSYGVLAQHGAGTPDGLPPPPGQAEALRKRANAALRLKRAAELYQRGDEQWHAPLVLVALYIVFEQLGATNPLYNHVEVEEPSSDEAAAHMRVCRQLRTELDALTP